MKVEVADIEKVVKWIKDNTHHVTVSVEIRHDKHLVFSGQDKYQNQIEIIVYNCDEKEQHLLKPTIKKTEQL